MRLFSHISSYIYKIDIVLPLKYIRHISVSKLLLSFYSDYVRHNNIAPKAPTQKMLSAFQVFRKSSKLPLSFMKLQSISIFLITSKSLDQIKVESSCLEVLWSILSKHSFVMPIATSLQIPQLECDAISSYGPFIVFVNEIPILI